ncbi:6-pyruvoyl trahydropterin synthase family protein [Kushneria konosiri]|uniref:6-carboxy-5,6,7,8-tetrahydropterin synthase n=1 Tax=Kushneria konosiri TaxID=698828 RepID=A0A2Z2HEL5_9GAMM|nr:6-carboxytetrahydropterin synthase [Kushneria konosiri]ARS53900.1 6-pyruvoyl tetrahydropterin synthase-related protein [Kushneria konosiri]
MILFVNALSALDVSIWCPQRGLVGASFHIDVELEGQLGEDGMLFDFGEVKPWIKSRIDASVDHTLLVPTKAHDITVSECVEGLRLQTRHPWPMELRAPRQAYTLLPWQQITPERLGEYLSAELSRRPPAQVEKIRVTLREEAHDAGGYTYSHGLRRHQGNCQRIAHGHRSRLAIWHNGQRSETLETQWSQRLEDIYLIDQADLIGTDNETCHVGYESAQGRFSIRLPRERTEILPTPTTVEQIANWMAQEIASLHGGSVRVQAFEGIDKGAVATAHGARDSA